jgi:drug/metabolite transporter (DMT)-like permease
MVKPVFAGLLSVMLLSESLSTIQVCGAALILLGIALAELRSASRRPAPSVVVQTGA